MNLNNKNISSITWAMSAGINALKKLRDDAKEEDKEKQLVALIGKFDYDIEMAENTLSLLKNIEYSDSDVVVKIDTGCDDCDGAGFIDSNDIEGNDERQKCDSCNFFESDEDAQKHTTNQ